MSLGGKSASALVKRARFAGRMIQWANESNVSFFPLDISTVRDFMKTLETASAIKECGETLNFLVHVVGVDSPLDVRERPAIKGAIRGAPERTKDFKQSRVLSVREVKILESLLFSQDVDPVDRYGAGVFLFQIYSRARVSDVLRWISTETGVIWKPEPWITRQQNAWEDLAFGNLVRRKRAGASWQPSDVLYGQHSGTPRLAVLHLPFSSRGMDLGGFPNFCIPLPFLPLPVRCHLEAEDLELRQFACGWRRRKLTCKERQQMEYDLGIRLQGWQH